MRGYLGQTLAFLHNQAHSILLELRSERATEPGCSLCHGSPPSPSRLLSGCPLLRAPPDALRTTNSFTPLVVKDTDWRPWCFAAAKPGYSLSQVQCPPGGRNDQYLT